MKTIFYSLILLPLLSLSQTLLAADDIDNNLETDLHKLQSRWAEVNYQLKDKPQYQAFEELIGSADQQVQTYPNSAEMLIWRGIIKSSYAGAKGGLGALKLAKSSKIDLEKALELKPDALNGSAYTSLGTLYFNVPGWPIGFGSDKTAKKLLKKALVINPTGIDPNYFYAQYLEEDKRYQEAQSYYQKALQAPNRPSRPLADSGRRGEIKAALIRIEKKLK